jgi:hypothetical protein
MVNDVAMYNGLTEAQLLAAMGVAPEVQNTGNRFPLLKINYEDEDAEGNTLRKGTFSYPTEQGTAYCKDVKLRVFADYLQYLDYDPEQNSVVNKTIIHRPGMNLSMKRVAFVAVSLRLRLFVRWMMTKRNCTRTLHVSGTCLVK